MQKEWTDWRAIGQLDSAFDWLQWIAMAHGTGSEHIAAVMLSARNASF